MTSRNYPLWLMTLCFGICHGFTPTVEAAERLDTPWKKHVVFTGHANQTVVGADFTGDGKVDVMASCGGATRLFVAPTWTEQRVYQGPSRGWGCIHSEVMDVDRDGDPDYVAAVARKGVFWLENPGRASSAKWTYHVIDNEIEGIHCTLKADINGDGHQDLLVNNFEPTGAAPNSLVWLEIPPQPRIAKHWDRFVLADGDAPGGNHYFGFGDVDGDGRGDVCIGAKGKPFQGGNWFAWWKNQVDVKSPWRKQRIADKEMGATCIMPADLNGDGVTDFFATRGHGKGVLWFEGPDWKKHEIDASLEAPHCLQVLDIDGDGDVDAATCARLSKLAVWYENNGRGEFTPRVVGKDQSAYDIRVLDMDGDQDLDFLIAGESNKNIVWYENETRKHL